MYAFKTAFSRTAILDWNPFSMRHDSFTNHEHMDSMGTLQGYVVIVKSCPHPTSTGVGCGVWGVGPSYLYYQVAGTSTEFGSSDHALQSWSITRLVAH